LSSDFAKIAIVSGTTKLFDFFNEKVGNAESRKVDIKVFLKVDI